MLNTVIITTIFFGILYIADIRICEFLEKRNFKLILLSKHKLPRKLTWKFSLDELIEHDKQLMHFLHIKNKFKYTIYINNLINK